MQQRYTRACPQETSYMCAVVPFWYWGILFGRIWRASFDVGH
jgi:hypothetical protein